MAKNGHETKLITESHMYRNRTASQHNFATLPLGDVPRSKFRMRQTRKQAFNASDLIPIMCEEVLPGDTWQHTESIMARLATPIAPALDDLALETFYFFIPNRLAYPSYINGGVETGWEPFITGRTNTGLAILTPEEQAGPSWPVDVGMLYDHFGIPIGDHTAEWGVTAAPIIDYFLIYNEWFRDQNLQPVWETASVQQASGFVAWSDITRATGTPAEWDGYPLRVNKRPDYFTKSLPWPQKGADVTLPLGTAATVRTSSAALITAAAPAMRMHATATGAPTGPGYMTTSTISGFSTTDLDGTLVADNTTFPANLYADLSTATAATINQIRLAVTTQQLLEKDARGGSRYIEQLLVHFGVRSPDYRLQRPEYLGGHYIPITVNPIATTTSLEGVDPESPQTGNLGAEMHAAGSKRTFTYAATEHGYIIGLACARATPTYQQGIRRHWGPTRQTRLGYYFPVFANIGEQAVQTQEIWWSTTPAIVNATWGYQERWAEYRYTPNEITGHLRSTSPTPMDWWHYAEEFGAEPALNAAFITDKTQETLARSLAADPAERWAAQIIMDVLHESNVARLMPTYGVPGIERF